MYTPVFSDTQTKSPLKTQSKSGRVKNSKKEMSGEHWKAKTEIRD